MAWLGDDGDLSSVTNEDLERVGQGGGSILPPGWYRCALIEDEAQSKPWGTGLNMQFQVLSGDYENRRIFDYLCVRHSSSPQAQEIARAKLKAFAIAAGAKNPDNVEDTEPLYHKPVMIEIIRQKDDTKYADDDGKKARIHNFVSVAVWKEEHSGEPTPGLERKHMSNPAEKPPPPVDDDPIPF